MEKISTNLIKQIVLLILITFIGIEIIVQLKYFLPGLFGAITLYVLYRNRHTQSFYKYLNWLFPVGRILFPGSFCTLEELSHAMVNATYNDARSAIFEVTDIQHAAAIIIQ